VLLLLAGLALAIPALGRSSPRQLPTRATAGRKGTLRVVVRGLRTGAPHARIVVTGPNGFRRLTTRSATMPVAAGRYLVGAAEMRAGATTFVPDVRMRTVAVLAGRQSTVTVRYHARPPRPAPQPPPPAATGTAPIITSVTGATGSVGNYFVWITVSYTDPECDVIGGTWSAQGGEGTFDFGAWGRTDLMRNSACTAGVGSLEFARSCIAVSRTLERVHLVDARGNRGTDFGFTFTCA